MTKPWPHLAQQGDTMSAGSPWPNRSAADEWRRLNSQIEELTRERDETRAALARIDQLLKVARQEGIAVLPLDLVADRAAIRGA